MKSPECGNIGRVDNARVTIAGGADRGLQCTFVSLPNPRKRITATRKEQLVDAVTRTPSDETTANEKAGNNTTSPPETLQYVGLTGDHDPFILQYCKTNRVQHIDGIQWTCHRLSSDPRRPASFTAVPDQHLDAHPSYYPLTTIREIPSPHVDRLVNAFFEGIHPAYPILDPQSFRPSTAPSTLVAAVFALAHPYCVEAQAFDPWVWIDFTSQALPIEARNAKLETIEAALLHSQRHAYIFRAPTMPGLWADVGSIVGMSQDVGLNIDASNWDIPEEQKKRRRRLWWAVYMQDKWTALTLGRPSYIHDDQHDVGQLEVTDIVPDPKASPGTELLPAQVFVAAARLTTILADILSQLYSVKAAKILPTLGIRECSDIASVFMNRLRRWKEDYLTPLVGIDTMHDPTGNLQLLYFTAEITWLRALLRTTAGSQYRQRSAVLISNVIDWLRNLQVNCLSGFWWMSSRISFAVAGGFIVGMFLSATDEEDVDYWTKQINTYRNLLKAHSVNFNFAKLASIRIDLLIQRDHSEDVEGGMSAIQKPQTVTPDTRNLVEGQIQESPSVTWPEGEVMNPGPFTTNPLQDGFPIDPSVAFGDTYGLEWEFDVNLNGLFAV
ncbi:fungal-specific transcription factor domain-containing protein [Aspergillus unguis]